MDELGNPISFLLSGSQIHDSNTALSRLETIDIHGSRISGDRAYGCEEICEYIIHLCDTAQTQYKKTWFMDWHLYKQRHLVECFFHKLKQFHRIATRYDKLASSFFAFITIAVITILLK